MFKRVFLFLLINTIVILSLSFFINILGLNSYLTKNGINLYYLILFSLIWGMSGSFISLIFSRVIAKKVYNIAILDPNTRVEWERELLKKVYEISKKNSLKKMPEVGIYNSSEINAFATGPSKNRSLIAVSTGLLSNMNSDQIDGVLGHEVSHIANGDMVTMTLLQGVINAFVLFFSRFIAYLLTINSKNEKSSYLIYYVVSFIIEIVLMLVGNLVISAYSRHREYKADELSAKSVGKNKMIAALRCLSNNSNKNMHPSFKSLQISNKSNRLSVFSSHPSIENRILKLEKLHL